MNPFRCHANPALIRCIALLTIAATAACTDRTVTKEYDVGWFSKFVKFEDQLALFAELGIEMNSDAKFSDLTYSRFKLEQEPFKLLATSMAYTIEREPWTPVADRLWMCDFERIEGPGSYRSILVRLERMTGGVLALGSITDHVFQPEGTNRDDDRAWVQFEHDGKTVRWHLQVEDDWLDPEILRLYDLLLQQSGAGLRLFGNFTDHGQDAFLGVFTPDQHKRFCLLTGMSMVSAH